jgi:hypothetical protein
MSPSQLVFSIQPGDPLVEPAERAADLAAAIQTVFPMDTDDAILNWNRIAVRLGYRYDVSVMIDDLLPLLAEVTDEPSGRRRVVWASDTFHADWDVHWLGDELLSVDAEWHSISGDYAGLLNERPTVTLPRTAFVAEWRRLLAAVLRGIDASGVKLERGDEAAHLRRLVTRTEISGWSAP